MAFCGNCGAYKTSREVPCPQCGLSTNKTSQSNAALGNNNAFSQPDLQQATMAKKNSTVGLKIAIVIVSIIAVIAIAYIIFPYIMSGINNNFSNVVKLDNSYLIEDDFSYGNCVGNSNVYQYGDNIYYGGWSGLCELSLDGSTFRMIDDSCVVDIIRGYDDKVVFQRYKINDSTHDYENTSICCYNVSSGATKEIKSEEGKYEPQLLFANEKWIFYVNYYFDSDGYYVEDGIRRIDYYGHSDEEIYKVPSDAFVDTIQGYNGYLYVDIANYGLIRIDEDGADSKLIAEWHEYRNGDVVVYNNKIYFGADDGIYSTDLQGNNAKPVSSDSCIGMLIINDTIYYSPERMYDNDDGSSYITGNGIICIDLQTLEADRILSNDNFLVGCAGNWLYFEDWSDQQQLCRIRLDGTGYMEMP